MRCNMEHNISALLEKKHFLDTEREKTYKNYLRILSELVNVELDIESIRKGEYNSFIDSNTECAYVFTEQDSNSRYNY